MLLSACSEYQISHPPSVEGPEGSPPATTVPEPAGSSPPDLHEPVADAGADAVLAPLDVVTLDATASYDPEGLEVTEIRWSLVSAPSGSTAALEDPGRPKEPFLLDLAGDYTFSLTVANELGTWDSTPDLVTVSAIPADGFYVQLSWDAATDLDLHLLNGSTPPFHEGDCSYCNLHPHWGDAGTADDPSLDVDAIDGFGPETITIDDPADGVYTAAVHFYGEKGDANCHGGCDPSNAHVVVYLDGAAVASWDRLLDADDQVWTVAEIEWPAQQVVPVDTVETYSDPSCVITF